MQPRQQRLREGIFYTPRLVVDAIVQQTVRVLGERRSHALTVLDPACGEGAFLQGAHRILKASGSNDHELYGVDTDQLAVQAARAAVPARSRAGERRIVWGDALVDTPLSGNRAGVPPLRWQEAFPRVFAAGGFDVIVGNPPYVNIRRLAQTQAAGHRAYLNRNYSCAYRGYDLYTLFLEKAFELLRPGGVCGMIVPNKIATLKYATPCRRLLVERTCLEHIADVAQLGVFVDASVYPYILIWRKAEPAPRHRVNVSFPQSAAELARFHVGRSVMQSQLSPESGWQLHGTLDLESRVATRRLDECCQLASGATGFTARRLADALVDHSAATDADFDFVVSGNIDRYWISRGSVRFMGKKYRYPRLPRGSSQLSPAKRLLYAGPKIVLAGMCRRLEAAWDPGGLALGVQVYAAHNFNVDPMYLLGLLNSRLFSHLFRLRFQAKRLAGHYLAINLGQLSQLPVCFEPGDLQRQISQGVRERLEIETRARQNQRSSTHFSATLDRLERQVDAATYQLYQLGDDEILELEESLSSLERKAQAPRSEIGGHGQARPAR